MNARAKRTNEKPTGYREVDLPHYEILVDGEVVGQVYAWLSRGNHYTSGSSKIWSYRVGPKTHARSEGHYCSKRDAQARLLEALAKEAS